MSVTMKSAVEKILSSHGIFESFQSFRDYTVKIASSGYMPLCIEKHDKMITVTHYFEQNGDLIADPDMEFVDLGGKDWMPVAVQHSTGHYMRVAALGENGHWKFNLAKAEELQSFSRMWARNLLSQGFAKGKLVNAGPA
jgi:hypothetical protein